MVIKVKPKLMLTSTTRATDNLHNLTLFYWLGLILKPYIAKFQNSLSASTDEIFSHFNQVLFFVIRLIDNYRPENIHCIKIDG